MDFEEEKWLWKEESSSSQLRAAFSTTHWSVILDASKTDCPTASQALEGLCRAYWYPLYAFVRRRGFIQVEAEDLTQAFFAYILGKSALKTVSREKGKFRTFLLAALNNFLKNEYDKSQARKRGGGLLQSWDGLKAEDRYLHEPVDNVTPEHLFDRRWAFTLIEKVLEKTRSEYDKAGRSVLFEQLCPFLVDASDIEAIRKAAVQLHMSYGAMKVALHRLRRRFGEYLRTEIASTVSSPDQIEDEIRFLFSVISK